MSTKVSFSSLEVAEVSNTSYDLIIATTGYETRARFVAERFEVRGAERWAPAFGTRQLHSFAKNKRFFDEAGFDTEVVDDIHFEVSCLEKLHDAASKSDTDRAVRILVDVSSMSRRRMACIVAALHRGEAGRAYSVDVLYSVARYGSPPSMQAPVVDFGAVSPYFAGWDDPSKLVSAVLGLGYERDQAIGVAEAIEPDDIWLFVPSGPDRRYLRSVRGANSALWDQVPPEHQILYSVISPLQTLSNLESLVYGVLRTRRCVLVPFGPKLFAWSCFVVAAMHYPRVSVWRVSSGQLDEPQNRRASDVVVGFNVLFEAPHVVDRVDDAIAAASGGM